MRFRNVCRVAAFALAGEASLSTEGGGPAVVAVAECVPAQAEPSAKPPARPAPSEPRPPPRRSGSSKATATWGPCSTPGRSSTEPAGRSYTVAGSGENMWAAKDAFHYAWKKASGDLVARGRRRLRRRGRPTRTARRA